VFEHPWVRFFQKKHLPNWLSSSSLDSDYSSSGDQDYDDEEYDEEEEDEDDNSRSEDINYVDDSRTPS